MEHLARQWQTLLIMGVPCQDPVKAQGTGKRHPKVNRTLGNP